VDQTWQPACDLEYLRLRAQMLKKIRFFFEERAVLEVETPLLCSTTGTDPQLDFFSCEYHSFANKESLSNKIMYLQTSPEFAMKRLLAAGSGSVFQICKAFRNGEAGQIHNPEFTILEWYRVGFDLPQLMDEVVDLISTVLTVDSTNLDVYKVSYVDLFQQATGLNPLEFCLSDYCSYAQENGISDAIDICGNDYSMWLDFIFSHKVQPVIEPYALALVYAYPAIQSSLARINTKNTAVADRFEVFIQGVEIANGFFELADVIEQEKRFDQENADRLAMGLSAVKKDQYFLNALASGLPDCSGIAIGLDRLLMMMTKNKSLNNVIAFPFDRA